MPSTLSATGYYATPKASRYLQQLCKHFGHKTDVRFDEYSGEAALSPGPCRMTAQADTLTIEVTGHNIEDLTRAKTIIDKHLERFAFREGFEKMDWRDPAV